MSQSIYICYPGVILSFLFEISLIFIYSYINLKHFKGSLQSILIGLAGFLCAVTAEGITINLISLIISKDSKIFTFLLLLFPGLFEETFRYFCLKYLFTKKKEKIISISYGIGHGGIESFLVGMSLLRFIFLKDTLINQGLLKQDLTFVDNLMSAVERFCAVCMHISLSVFVYKAIKDKNLIYYFYAIFLHDLIDLIAFFYQKELISNIVIIEMLISLYTFFLCKRANQLYVYIANEEISKPKEKKILLKDKKDEI